LFVCEVFLGERNGKLFGIKSSIVLNDVFLIKIGKLMKKTKKYSKIFIVLGDQLTCDSDFFKDFDFKNDCVWMAEVREESTQVWSHKSRIVLYLSAMRHFAKELLKNKYPLEYTQLVSNQNSSLKSELLKFLADHSCKNVKVRKPGDHRVEMQLKDAVSSQGLVLEIVEDDHFLCTSKEFEDHSLNRKQLRMEYFYREMRVKFDLLMKDGKPAGGEWNFDKENRKSFSKNGPDLIPSPVSFPPDKITSSVIQLVEKIFPDHPGDLAFYDWPVNAVDANIALIDFLDHRLASYGDYQDAMWVNQPWLYHSRIASCLNLHMLHPLAVIKDAEKYYENGKASLFAVEGFIRQILGWREYVRNVYIKFMPEYIHLNFLQAKNNLPSFFWDNNTDMHCLKCAIGQTLKHGYAHHIQRLMVTGLFCLLFGVEPKQVHEWYLAVYVDAVEWVELPNTLGMSQYADNGIMASKPYIASGKYIDRMSNYCKSCKYDPAKSVGEDACPFTTMYWDFIIRNEKILAKNPRMGMQVRNMQRLAPNLKLEIASQATAFRLSLNVLK